MASIALALPSICVYAVFDLFFLCIVVFFCSSVVPLSSSIDINVIELLLAYQLHVCVCCVHVFGCVFFLLLRLKSARAVDRLEADRKTEKPIEIHIVVQLARSSDQHQTLFFGSPSLPCSTSAKVYVVCFSFIPRLFAPMRLYLCVVYSDARAPAVAATQCQTTAD